MGSKCASCTAHTQPGHCSILNKTLVREVPYTDKAAEQKEILASGPSTEISYASLVNNGLSMMEEYDLQNREASVDLDPTPDVNQLQIEFGNHELL
jgi:hypothetical protein